MLRVRLITDPLDLGSASEHEPDCTLLAFLQEYFTAWPPTARLYKDAVSDATDITPTTETMADALGEVTEGDYYVVVYPGDPITALIAVGATLFLTAAVLLFLMPQLPGGTQAESANNSLGNRANKARPNARIPDIFGEVHSIPELLTVPLVTFESNLEVEVCLMAVGRGAYEITGLRDGDTPLALIAGAGATVFGPNTSPNSGAAQLTVGTPVSVPLKNVVKLNEVNGQQLDSPNANTFNGNSDIRFVAPNAIQLLNPGGGGGIFGLPGRDFTKFFGVGDQLTISNANFGSVAGTVFDATTQNARFYPDRRIEFQTFNPTTLYSAGQLLVIQNAGFAGVDSEGDVVYVDVSGTYTIASVSATEIQLV